MSQNRAFNSVATYLNSGLRDMRRTTNEHIDKALKLIASGLAMQGFPLTAVQSDTIRAELITERDKTLGDHPLPAAGIPIVNLRRFVLKDIPEGTIMNSHFIKPDRNQ